ncbi:monovalent cation/H+ antiporter subunit D family protein [Porticoccus litoralis]|uniref:Monovalent cation/H+ antiporter subunit D family protein n=1 Tax=Porticoccus litoralis TaxID=434086 RepID=A0AAW8AZM5_9GAMM|nr:monovalent cation/H+ antiporter subunit D family protein [Porticoccus litoralis]MDP1519674.1 monovalent cation/H+ antiporter subunit D family protein [Porticoccus litoralis]
MNFSVIGLMQAVLVIPLLAAAGVALTGLRPNLREGISLVSGALLFAVVWSLYQSVMAGDRSGWTLLELLPGLTISFRLEPLGILFCLIASSLWMVTVLYSIGYMRGHGESNQTRFYALFAIAIASVGGIALADNLLTLFIFYEVLTLSTYPLVTHAGTDKARRGGRTYLGLLLGTSIVCFLPAIIGTWVVAGTLTFKEGGIFGDDITPVLLSLLLVLFVFGIGKAAVMPFHRWLPAAMVAPTPVSALLHAVAVVKAGVFALVKVGVFIFGLDTLGTLAVTEWLLYLVAFGVLAASLVAMRQNNLKARLAYSTISQLGYISLGVLLATSAGLLGSALHIAMHAFGKITLFFCAGAILVASHKSEISDMRGLGRAMPLTMAAFFIASLSIIGLPPAGGSWSKWYLILGTLEAGQWLLMGVLMLSSLLNIAYLLPIPLKAFFATDSTGSVGAGEAAGIREAPLTSLLAIMITTLMCLLLFFYPQPLYDLARSIG